jgi:density-regulated protein DRP1
VKKKKPKTAGEGKSGGNVFIERFQRQKKKFVTVIAGLDEYSELNLKDVAKRMGKKFACSATVAKLEGGKQQVQLQGDVKDDLPMWLVEEFQIPEDSIFFLDKGKIDAAF